LKKITFAREDVTPDKAYPLMANMGQEVMPVMMGTMEQEVPLIIYTHQLYNVMKSYNVTDMATCKTFY